MSIATGIFISAAIGFTAGKLLAWILDKYSRRLSVKILYMQWGRNA